MKNFKISIIVPAFNCQDTIKRCVFSFINQTYRNIEIIIIDDGSTDLTYTKCKEIEDSRVFIFRTENRGVSHARNIGLQKMNGEFFMFCDSDDYVDQDVIEKLVKNIEIGTLPRVAYKKEFFNGKIIKKESLNIKTQLYIHNILTGQEEGFCWGYLFDKKIGKDLKFDEKTSYLEDTIFLIEYLKKIDNIIFINDTCYHYVYNNNGISSSNVDVEKKIIDMCYSISVIDELINEKYKIVEYKKELAFKKVIILNYLCQDISFDELHSIFTTNNIYNELKKINLRELKIKDRIFVWSVLKENYLCYEIYKFIRKILKRIIRRK